MGLVVKAKYKADLRKFHALPTLSLAGLRSKICDLFQFDPSAQFVITYVDEDNDNVTMADDADLLYVLNQNLNPLRLEVSLMSQNNRAAGKQAQSQPSTPRKFSITKKQGQPFDLRSICSEETSKCTKALRKAILKGTKETANVASTAAVTELIEGVVKLVSTRLAELIEDVVKLVSTDLGPVMERQQTGGAGSGTQPNSTVPSINESAEQGTGNEEEYEKRDLALSSPPAPQRSLHKERSSSKGRRLPKSPVHRPTKYPAYTRPPGCNLSNSPKSICGSQGPSAGKPANKAPANKAPANKAPADKAPGKLDGRFVHVVSFAQDATTFNGTQFAPGTHFTKTWRLRNNGTLKWPCQTQLVRIRGHDLGTPDVLNLEIPKEGFEVGKELDVKVHFIAPIQPGRYQSYWRLKEPSGQMFGKQVWILIQVVRREECLPNLMNSRLTLDEVEQNNLTQEQTKQKTVDVSSQDTSERACLGDSKMDLDPNELGCSSMVADKEFH